jgi:hypothetical protein
MLLDRYEEDQKRMVTGLRTGMEKICQNSDEDKVWSISGQRAVFSYANQMLLKVQEEVYKVLNDDALAALAVEFTPTCQRSVDIYALLMGESKLSCGQVAYHSPLEGEFGN